MDAEQMKKLLKLLEQALKCEQVATITITIKPNQKPKQEGRRTAGKIPPAVPFHYNHETTAKSSGRNNMDISIKVTYKSEGLQKLRKAAGLSQSQLADLAGIKVQVLQQYERGARDINGAKLPTLLKICNALECRLADIITDEETLELLKKYEEH